MLTAWSVRYPTLMLLALLLVMLWGFSYFFTMSRREDPNILVRGAQVVTIYPGALPSEVEEYVTDPLEELCSDIPEVSEVYSLSRYSVSVLWVHLEDNVRNEQIPQIWDKLRAKISLIAPSLPQGCGAPNVNDEFFDTCSHVLAISGAEATPRELAAIAHRVKQRMSKLAAAGRVAVFAEQPERIYLEFDPAKLVRFGISADQIIGVIQGQNTLMPSGSLDVAGDNYTLEAGAGFRSLDELRQLLILVTPEGQQIHLRDLGNITYGYEDPPQVVARLNGQPAVVVSVVMKTGKNVIELGRQVEQELEAIRRDLPAGINIDKVQDQPAEVNKRLDIFLGNLRDGVLLVVLIVFLLLGFRASLPIAIAIPLNMVCTFAVLSLFKTDLHQLSIAALIIGLGMIVDDAVVVTDNIYRYLLLGYKPRQAALTATREVAVPVFTSTLTTVFGFAPLLGLRGDSGTFVRDIPIVVSVSLLLSYVLAVTITPLVASRVFRLRTAAPREALLNPLIERLRQGYPAILRYTQRHAWMFMGLVIATTLASLLLFPRLGVQFFPGAERDQFVIDVYAPEGTSIVETSRITEYVEQILSEQPDIVNYIAYIGQGGPRFYYNIVPETLLSNYAQVVVNTASVEATERLVLQLRQILRPSVPGARIEVKILEQGPPVGAPIQLVVRGPQIGELKRLSKEIQASLAQVSGVIDIRDNFGRDSYLLKLHLDDNQLRSVGQTPAQVKLLTALAFSGAPVTSFRAPDREIPVVARLIKSARQSTLDVERLYIHNSITGDPVTLSALMRFTTESTTSSIERFNSERQLNVSAYVEPGMLPSAILREIRPLVEAIDIPTGYKLLYRGEAEESAEAFSGLGQATVVALLLILLMLMIEFKSLRISLVVYIAVPLALIGAIGGLYLTGWPFGFIAGLGFMSLAGIVVKNGIVLIDFVLQALREGQGLEDALAQAGQARLRPILLTSATTVLGLLPLGLLGGSMWAPMCFAIIFGLISSTVLTLFVVPLLFRLVAGRAVLRMLARERQDLSEQ